MSANSMSTKAVMQALLDKEPLGAAEIREMLIRHVMAKHSDPKGTAITDKLLDVYKLICARDNVVIDFVPAEEVEGIMKENFGEAYVKTFGQPHDHYMSFWVWPQAVPTGVDLPRELCVFLGQGIGSNVGREVRKHHADLKTRQGLKN